jgi:hypothetical protein
MPNEIDLRDYVDAMFAEKEKALRAALTAQEKAVSAALESSDKAITKAEANAEKWRENANEWRGAMSDRDRELPSRREVESLFSGMDGRVQRLEQAAERKAGEADAVTDGREQRQITLGQLIAAAGVVVAAMSLIAAAVIAAFS